MTPAIMLYWDFLGRKYFGPNAGGFEIVPQDYTPVCIQVVKTQRLDLDADGLAAEDDDINVDMSAWTSCLFGLKRFADAESGGPFAASVAGYLTSDSRHDLELGRLVTAIALPQNFDKQLYQAAALLQTSGGQRWTMAGLNARVPREFVVGDEPNLPASLPSFSYSTLDGVTTIAAAQNRSRTVAVANLTADTGRAVVTQLDPTGNTGLAQYTYRIENGQIVITTTANPLNGGTFNFYWQVIRL